MSDSEPSAPADDLPSDDAIERALRRVVQQLTRREEDVTVNKARTLAENELDLDVGFLKCTPKWKERSKKVVQDAVEQEAADDVSPPAKPDIAVRKPAIKSAPKQAKKRKSDDDDGEEGAAGAAKNTRRPRKKARKVDSDEDVSDIDISDQTEDSEKPAAKKTNTKKSFAKRETKIKKMIAQSDSDEGAEIEVASKKSHHEPNEEQKKEEADPTEQAVPEESELSDVSNRLDKDGSKPNGVEVAPPEDDESDLSSLIDEAPAKKKRQKKATVSAPKIKAKAGGKSAKSTKSKSGPDLSADEEEIKRLQGWLVKCGVRKMWWKELAPYPTPNEKIRHLKEMLDDVGMTGRYSNEKAKQIKESRELAAELEAVEEFNERWGQSDDDAERSAKGSDAEVDKKIDTAPKKRLPKGFIDFGDSGDDGSD